MPHAVRHAVSLHGAERRRLLDVLALVRADQWLDDTPCPAWTVHDLAAHVLGDDLGRLARSRDGWTPLVPDDDEPLVSFIDRINEEWVQAAQRISPSDLIDLLARSGADILAFWESVDQEALGEPVSWAGPEPAPVWLDCARDLTEYWVHRRQLAAAIGRAPVGDPAADHAVLGTMLHALPYRLRDIAHPDGASVRVVVHGTGAGAWSAQSDGSRWQLVEGPGPAPAAAVEVDGDLAWRRWTRGATAKEMRAGAYTGGDEALCSAVLDLVAAIV